MSLINEMLRDLESRQPKSASGNDALSGLRSPVATHGEHTTSWRLWLQLGTVVVVTVAGGMAVMHWPTSPAPTSSADPVAPVTTPLAEVAPALPEIAPPAAQTSEAKLILLAPAAADIETAPPVASPSNPGPIVTQAKPASPTHPTNTTPPTPPSKPVVPVQTPQMQTPEPPAARPETPAMAATVRSEPSSPERLAMRDYEAGLDALQRNARHTAETRFRDALDRAPALTSARAELARLLIADRRTQEAGELLVAGLALTPEHSGLTQLRARLFVEEGALGDAVALLRASPPRLDENPEHHAMLAAVEQRRGRDEAAVEIYRQLIVLRPEAGQWQMGLAISLERLGARAPAAGAYASALQDPRLPTALRRYAQQRLAALRS